MARINGNKITLKINSKYYAGVTDTDMSGSVKWDESLIKEDNGIAQKELNSHDEKISISGIVSINETGDETDHTDWADIRAAYRAAAPIPFVYGMFSTGKPEITGNLRINSYSEKAGSSGKATYSLECEIIQDEDLVYATTEA